MAVAQPPAGQGGREGPGLARARSEAAASPATAAASAATAAPAPAPAKGRPRRTRSGVEVAAPTAASVTSLAAPPAEAAAPVVEPPAPAPAPARTPVPRRPAPAVRLGRRSGAARVQARRVSRVVRRVDPWSVLKVSAIFFVCLYIVLVVAGMLLWSVAVTTGTLDNAEDFIRELFARETFEFDGRQILEASLVGGAVLVVAGTGAHVALAVLFNLISDLVGGIRLTVVEEEIVRRREG